jgi:uncharacterized protein (TIRG00374 family)
MDKNAKRAAKAFVFIGVLALLYFILRKIGFREIYGNFMLADKTYLVLAFVSALLLFLTWSLKWMLLVKEVAKPRFIHIFPVIMAGSFVNTTTPGARVGGSPLRAYFLSKEHGIEKSKFLATAIADNAANTIAFAALSIFSALFVILFVEISTNVKVLLEIVLVCLALVIGAGILLRQKVKFKKKHFEVALKKVYYFPIFRTLRKKFATYKKFENYTIRKLNNIVNVLKKIVSQKKVFIRDIGLAFAMLAFNYAGTFFIFSAFGYEISIIAIVIVVTLSVLIGSLFGLPGGIGIIETAMISLYLSFGINAGVAATVAVIDRFIFYFYSLFVGGICMAYLSWRHK